MPCSKETESVFKRPSDNKNVCYNCFKAYPNCEKCRNNKCFSCFDGYFLADPLPDTNQVCSLCDSNTSFQVSSTDDGVKRCRSCSTFHSDCVTCSVDSCKSCKSGTYLYDVLGDGIFNSCVNCEMKQYFKGIYANF